MSRITVDLTDSANSHDDETAFAAVDFGHDGVTITLDDESVELIMSDDQFRTMYSAMRVAVGDDREAGFGGA